MNYHKRHFFDVFFRTGRSRADSSETVFFFSMEDVLCHLTKLDEGVEFQNDDQ